MQAIQALEASHRKAGIPAVQPGDTVRVHQQIREGNKSRIQVFEGVVIRTRRMQELTANITVRRIASGVGVEKTFPLHSPNVAKVEILRRAKVRRNFLSYLRARRGKSARLQEVAFDKAAANALPEPAAGVSDTEVTEIDAGQHEDALDQAVPLDVEAKAEDKAAAADAGEASADQTVTPPVDEQELPAAEAQAGVDQADPGEGEAVEDNPVVDKDA